MHPHAVSIARPTDRPTDASSEIPSRQRQGRVFAATLATALLSAAVNVASGVGLVGLLVASPGSARAQAAAPAGHQTFAPAPRQAGLMFSSVPAAGAGLPATALALYYPTAASARGVPMGPFTPQVALQAPPDAQVKGLILLSHGTGGSELGHTSLAEALARSGYLVAALRHPGDNWQDRSLLKATPERFFDERPRQASRVIDYLLADPTWRERIARDARGPRVAAVGHSAGGYTVLALAGGQPDLTQIGRHCAAHQAEDPIFCSMGADAPGRGAAGAGPTAAQATGATVSSKPQGLTDPRVRAVVALSPVGAVLTPASLAGIRVPALVYVAEGDRFLVPRFHGQWVAAQARAVQLRLVPGAMHFAFMDTPSMPIPSEDGDVGADAPGFDRAAFLRRLGLELPAFFDQAW